MTDEQSEAHGSGDRRSMKSVLVPMLVVAAVSTVAADLLYAKHGEYAFQEWIGFDAIYGFLAGLFLVVTARGLRGLLERSEDYHD